MTFKDLQNEVSQYIYSEDEGMLRATLAATISNRLSFGDPIWMILIGPSSSGKSQVLRPLALTDTKFIHRVDDLTENTLISGVKVKEGKNDISLLKKIGEKGIIVISDFTVIFSKSAEEKNSILSQLRMVYDGEMIKYSGVKDGPTQWKGSIGILAGSTPSIYSHFESVADMGERFIYYRMKDYDAEKATHISLSRALFGKNLDEKLSQLYREYIREVGECALNTTIPEVSEDIKNEIIQIALFATKLRAPAHYDKYLKAIDRIPVPEMPMRVALQLLALARGLMVMKYYDTGSFDLEWEDIKIIEWCAYSLANEERRACLHTLAQCSYGTYLLTSTIADKLGLATEIVRMNLQHLSAIGVITRTGEGNGLKWGINDIKIYQRVRSIEKIVDDSVFIEREVSEEEHQEKEEQIEIQFNDM